MKLYYARGACSLAVRIVIHELNLQCEYESVNLTTKETEYGTNYFSINPKGSVPALQLDTGMVLTENCVIQQYLADMQKNIQLLPPLEDFNRYHVLEWLNFISTDIHKNFGALFNEQIPDEVKEIYRAQILNKFAIINSQLENNKFIMGKQFTLPDAYMFVMLLWAAKMKFNLDDLTHLLNYFAMLKEYPAIVKSLKEEGLSLS